MEHWIQRDDCKVIHGFSTAWGSVPTNLCVVHESTVKSSLGQTLPINWLPMSLFTFSAKPINCSWFSPFVLFYTLNNQAFIPITPLSPSCFSHIRGRFSALQETFGRINHNFKIFLYLSFMCIYYFTCHSGFLMPLVFYHFLMLKCPRIVSLCTLELFKMSHAPGVIIYFR